MNINFFSLALFLFHTTSFDLILNLKMDDGGGGREVKRGSRIIRKSIHFVFDGDVISQKSRNKFNDNAFTPQRKKEKSISGTLSKILNYLDAVFSL